MSPRLRSVAGSVAGVVVAIVVALWQAARYGGAAVGDPDRDFHLGISRLMVEHGGFVHSVVEPVELGWQHGFPDKETLFHVLTAFGWWLGGEAGVAAVPSLCAALALIVLIEATRREIGLGPSVVVVAAIVGAAPIMGYRMTMVRPQVLAVLLLVTMAVAVHRRRPWATALLAAAFALAYHALYLPLALLGARMLVDGINGGAFTAPRRRLLLSGLGGLVVGVVVNPAFPGSLIASGRQLALALGQAPITASSLPSEMAPLTTDSFGAAYGLVCACLVVAAVVAARVRAADDDDGLVFFGVVAAGFLVLALRQPRACEYLVPFTALVVASTMRRLADAPRARRVGLAVVVVWSAAQLALAAPVPDRRAAVASLRAAVGALPADATRVFNLDWADGAVVFAHRPGVSFIDLLDPSLLAFHDPERYALRQAVADERVADVGGVIFGVFGASHVFITDAARAQHFATDAAFERIWPRDDVLNAAPALFAPRAGYREAFVSAVDVAFVGPVEQPPEVARVPWRDTVGPLPAVFFNLAGRAPRAAKGPVCAALRVSADEVTRLAGATTIGLAGGPWVRAFDNGVPVAELVDDGAHRGLVRSLFALPSPVTASDRLELLVCAADVAQLRGVAVSLWTPARRVAVCGAVAPSPFAAVVDDEQPPCPAPLAAVAELKSSGVQ